MKINITGIILNMNLNIIAENGKESQRAPSRSRSRLQKIRAKGVRSRLSALGERYAEYNERGELIWYVLNSVIENGTSSSTGVYIFYLFMIISQQIQLI